MAAALPTVVWRVLVGAGATLGTPLSSRESEALPGAGTGYVVTLSAVHRCGAADRGALRPRRRPGSASEPARQWQAGTHGSDVISVISVISAISWSRVDPFRDAALSSGWSRLSSACYAVATAWPVLLTATTVGCWQARRRARPPVPR